MIFCHKRFSLRLKNYLVVFVVFISLLCFLGLLVFPMLSLAKLNEKQTEQFCTSIVAQTCDNISQLIVNLEANFYSFVNSDVVYREICQNENENITSEDFTNTFLSYFPRSSMEYHFIDSVDLYVKNNNKTFHVGNSTKILEDPFNSIYRNKSLTYPLVLNWIGYTTEPDETGGFFEISKLIYDTKTYEELGFVVIRISPAFFRNQFINFESLDISNMYLLSSTGIIYSSLSPVLVGTYMDERYLEELDNHTGLFQKDDRYFLSENLMSTYSVGSYPEWQIVIELERSNLYSDLYKVLSQIGLIVLMIVVVAIIVICFFAKGLSTPILAVANGFGDVEKFNYSAHLKTKSNIKEIQIITEGYNHLLSHLNQLINTVYVEKMTINELRYASLMAKINPHFLFNTLQMISWKAAGYHADDVSEMIKSLCFMLESNLLARESSYVTLEQEREYLRNYIYILQCKYESKIDFSLNIPDELLQTIIPSHLLQPLVENAVIHGVAVKLGHGNVTVTVCQKQEDLTICIADDGNGIMPAQLSAILEDLQNPNTIEKHVSGNMHNSALKNVYTRLHILYGERFSFDIQSTPFIGTRMEIIIPIQTEEESDRV